MNEPPPLAHAVRSVIMIHQEPEGLVVSNKYILSAEQSGLGACISSRITTVIHVEFDYRINYNCFNEPFAVSLYNTYTYTCMA